MQKVQQLQKHINRDRKAESHLGPSVQWYPITIQYKWMMTVLVRKGDDELEQ